MKLNNKTKVTFTVDQESATIWNKRQIKLFSHRQFIVDGDRVTVFFPEYVATYGSLIAIFGEFLGDPEIHN